jgi:hypothetical protein
MNAERYGSPQNEDVSQLTDGTALRGYAEGFVRSGELHTVDGPHWRTGCTAGRSTPSPVRRRAHGCTAGDGCRSTGPHPSEVLTRSRLSQRPSLRYLRVV